MKISLQIISQHESSIYSSFALQIRNILLFPLAQDLFFLMQISAQDLLFVYSQRYSSPKQNSEDTIVFIFIVETIEEEEK